MREPTLGILGRMIPSYHPLGGILSTLQQEKALRKGVKIPLLIFLVKSKNL